MPQINRSQLIFFIIFLTLILPGPQDRSDNSASPLNGRRLALFRDEVSTSIKLVNESSWEGGYGNLTGFKLSYQDSLDGRNVTEWPIHQFSKKNPWIEEEQYSILPNEVSLKLREVWSPNQHYYDLEEQNYFFNVTGSLRGSFKTLNSSLAPVNMPLPKYLSEKPRRIEPNLVQDGLQESSNGFDDTPTDPTEPPSDSNKVGNISEILHGDIRFDITTFDKLKDPYVEDAVGISVKLKLNDFEELHDNSLALTGVYFSDTGNLVATTRTAKFAGMYALPHLVLDEPFNNKTKTLLNDRLSKIKVDNIDLSSLDELVDSSTDHCEYVLYAKFKPTTLSKQELLEIDDELMNPLGRPIKKIPDVEIDRGIIYSPDCGLIIQVNESSGLRRELQIKKLRTAVLIGILLLFGQIFLSIDQMNATNTPSTMSRISFWTILLINLVDGSLSMLYLLCSAVIEEIYLPLLVSSLLAFTLASVFEMRYMILIYSSQINERNITARVALQGAPLDDVDTDNGTILPTTQTRAPQPQPQPQFADDEQTISGQIYSKTFFVLIIFTFLTLNSIMWPKKSRLIFEYIALTLLSSYWAPQIYRNVVRGSRRSFKWKFIIGTSVLRFSPIAYVCLYRDNPFHHHYDLKLFTVILTWILLQIFLLLLQEFFGPRFLLPDRFLPKSYDYHPLLTESDLENGFGIEHDDSQSLLSHHEDGKCKADCAICMTEVELPILKDNSTSVNPANLLLRRGYMVTPCRHIFHTSCLESWMKYKLQCPTCRNPLPPL